MGQTLSEPVTVKETSCCGNDMLKVGASCMQGWRINMEDAHTHLLSLPDDHEAAFFAVYDGHGGAKVAKYAGCHVHRKIVSQPAYQEGDYVRAIQAAFLEVDQDMLNDDVMKEELAGSTGVVILIKEGKMYCGNVGDSRAVSSVAGRTVPLSFDHKPSNKEEARRINAAGGWVDFNRVNGNLALSRAFGDFVFKKNEKKPAQEQIVTAYPDVSVEVLTPDHEFVLLACDGIWDVMSNDEVIDFVRVRLAEKIEPEIICEELMTRCLAPDASMGGLGCDNMTVVLVCFLNGRSFDHLAAKCQRPVSEQSDYPRTIGCCGTALQSNQCHQNTNQTALNNQSNSNSNNSTNSNKSGSTNCPNPNGQNALSNQCSNQCGSLCGNMHMHSRTLHNIGHGPNQTGGHAHQHSHMHSVHQPHMAGFNSSNYNQNVHLNQANLSQYKHNHNQITLNQINSQPQDLTHDSVPNSPISDEIADYGSEFNIESEKIVPVNVNVPVASTSAQTQTGESSRGSSRPESTCVKSPPPQALSVVAERDTESVPVQRLDRHSVDLADQRIIREVAASAVQGRQDCASSISHGQQGEYSRRTSVTAEDILSD